jgi:D-sedoheptulose 7-phosphate isomerase
VIQSIDFDQVATLIDLVDSASKAGKHIFFIANGGSAAVGSHWVNDLVAGAFQEEGPHFRALCLADNVESVTAIGNDVSFEDIFANQLKVHVNAGDVLVAMSVSGNSENILRAVAVAREAGATSFGICGMQGGKLKDACDHALLLETTPDEYGPVEDGFSIIEHMVTGYLIQARGKALHH